ncbi:hypothetical protein [Phormidesmis priestleyi]|uniref:hypothetical protein n=1 Tax=Phormidesmis priestleyi TaxID=268141 RepID=UPI0018D44A4B|nr:hypothetical protein [Phormidesmis priestleyi]
MGIVNGSFLDSLKRVFMTKVNRRAGQNIRELAIKRRLKAIASFVSAGCVFFFPLFLVNEVEKALKPLSSLNPSHPQSSLNLPPTFYAIVVILPLGLVANGVF